MGAGPVRENVIMETKNREGKIVQKGDDYPHLSDLDLENAVFERMLLPGAISWTPIVQPHVLETLGSRASLGR